MMRPCVVAEGESDRLLLLRVLSRRSAAPPPQVIAAGGRSSVASIAKSLLVARHTPVALLMDAESLDADYVRQQERTYYDLLYPVSAHLPFRVFFAVPELEVVFFEVSQVLPLILPGLPIDDRTLEGYRARPRQHLHRLIRARNYTSFVTFFNALSPKILSRLARHHIFKSIASFLSEPKPWLPGG